MDKQKAGQQSTGFLFYLTFLISQQSFQFRLIKAYYDIIIDENYRDPHLLCFVHHFPGFYFVF